MRVPNTGDKPPPPTPLAKDYSPKPTTHFEDKGFTNPQTGRGGPNSPGDFSELETVLEPAGFGRRLLAYFIDGIILFAVHVLIIAPAYGLSIGADVEALTSVMKTGHEAAITQEFEAFQEKYRPADNTLALVSFGYLIVFWAAFGATLGKMAMNLKVVRLDGSRLSPLQSVGRALGYWLSSIILMLGFIWILFDHKKQGWHDKIASTLVIKTR